MEAQADLGLVIRPARDEDFGPVLAMHVRALRRLGLDEPCDGHLVTFLERAGAINRAALKGGGYVVASRGPRILAGAGFCQQRPPYEQVLQARGLRLAGGQKPRVCGAVVDPDFAGYGIGGLLMRWIEEQALDRGLEALRLTTPRMSQSFYAGLGWRVGGRLWLEVTPGMRLEAVEMHKNLLTGAVPGMATMQAAPALLH